MRPSERIEEIYKNLYISKYPRNALEDTLWNLGCRIQAITDYLDEQEAKREGETVTK